MRLLAVNHTALVSGGERALLDLLAALPADVEPTVACPDGALAAALAAGGVPRRRVRAVDGGLKLHPRHSPAAVAALAAATLEIRRAARATRADVVHANSIRAGIAAAAGRALGAPATVVHVHDCLPDDAVSNATRALVALGADVLLANSRHTADNFTRGRAAPPVHVVHNPIDLDRFDPAGVDRAAVRERLGVPPRAPLLTVVAQLTPWKGQETAIRALAGIARERPDARLLLVGEAKFVSAATRYDNRAYVAGLERLVDELGLGGSVAFTGERSDVPELLAASDAVLLPSWEEPFGRVVVEAMAMERVVLATAIGGPAEVIADGTTGRLLPPRAPEAWAAAVLELLGDPERGRAMGRRARAEVARFDSRAYAASVVAAYRHALELRAARRGRRRGAPLGWARP
jgi:glycosyltransferase involved in cell wall biosynthesis